MIVKVKPDDNFEGAYVEETVIKGPLLLSFCTFN